MYGASFSFAKLHCMFLRNSTRRNSTLRQSALLLNPKNDPHAVISFDVFDTLVRRPFARPDDALSFLELKFQVTGWLAARKNAEKTALQASGKESISLSQIYAYVPAQWGFMEQEEIKFDLEILRPNRDALELFNGFRTAGKTIIIATDTYYDSRTIAKILESNGYCGYSRIFTSCESGKTKSRGTLFDVILHELGLQDPVQMLHIGDNPHSDQHSPRQRGICTLHFPGVMETFLGAEKFTALRKSWKRKCKAPLRERLLSSYQIGVLAAMYREGYFDSIDLFTEMFAYAFPFLLLHFDNFLYAILKKSGFNNLAFIARDGYLLKEVFEKRHNASREYNAQYLYASRFLIRALTLELSGTNASDARTILRFLAESHPEIAVLFEGISFTEENHEKILAIFHANLDKLKLILQKDQDIYSAYIDELELREKDVLCIDWGGINLTAQRFLQPFFHQTKGVYCNVCHSVDLDIENFIGTLFSCYELVEVYITSPEAPICAIAKESDHFVPVHNKTGKTPPKLPPFEGIRSLTRRFLDDFDFPAITHEVLPIKYVMDIYRDILPGLSNSACAELAQYRNCATIAHGDSDYVDVWSKLRARYRLPGRIAQAFETITSWVYRKYFRSRNSPKGHS